ncbi:hypothetical protein GCM10023216_10580 [Isoptericola chiayiensis]|uniref:Uncharacterized protein n=1 Tax=Isoptericola chiayiensis TaxID=579446 RepID=A0ABP8Y9K8_9MICO|nr:hypothetical protein [Isoptericola chiayiensis]NOW00695.1 hypothetical protein [Isoptericola chiayiensis]
MTPGGALDTAIRLAVLVLLIAGVAAAVTLTSRRSVPPGRGSVRRPLAPVPTAVRALLSFVALGLLGATLPVVPVDGGGGWLPLGLGVLAVGLLWCTLAPLLRDVLDAVRPRTVVGTVTDRRRSVHGALDEGGVRRVAECFVRVVDDGGTSREYRVRPELFGRVGRGDQVRLSVAARSGYVHAITPAGTVARGVASDLRS